MQLLLRFPLLLLLLAPCLSILHPKRVSTKILKLKAPFTTNRLGDRADGFYKQTALSINQKKEQAKENRSVDNSFYDFGFCKDMG